MTEPQSKRPKLTPPADGERRSGTENTEAEPETGSAMASSSVSEPAKKKPKLSIEKGELEKLKGELETLKGELETLKGERKELEGKRDEAHAAANSAVNVKDRKYEEKKEKDATAQIDSTTAQIDSTTAHIDSTTALVIAITKKMTGDIQGIGRPGDAPVTVPPIWDELFELASKETSVFDDKVVDIGNVSPLGQIVPSERIFVRPCYKILSDKVWEQLFAGKMRIALCGTPGIGKSLLGLLILIELIRKLRAEAPGLQIEHIVYEQCSTETENPVFYLIDIQKQSLALSNDDEALRFAHLRTTFLLKDGACKAFAVKCPVLWVSSPRPSSMRKWDFTASIFFVPPMEADELVECWKKGCAPSNLFNLDVIAANASARDTMGDAQKNCMLDEDSVISEVDRQSVLQAATIRRWAADLGPVTRHVFNPGKAYQKLKSAVDDLGAESFDYVQKIARNSCSTSDNFKQSHRLLTMYPTNDLTYYHLAPASARIGRLIFKASVEEDMAHAGRLLGDLTGERKGLVFEPYAHCVLAAGGSFPLRHLCGTALAAGEDHLVLQPLVTKEIANTALDTLVVGDGEYHVPIDPTFPVVDSWTKTHMFQMTVSLDHPIKSGAGNFKALKGKTGQGRGKVVFVVPENHFEKFKAQPLVLTNGKPAPRGGGPQGGWNELDQYVIYV